MTDEINYLANNLENFELISVNDVISTKGFGKELVYTYNSNLGPTKSKEIMIRNNTHLFFIIFNAQKDEFDEFSPTVNRVIDSFQLTAAKLS